MSQGAGPDRRKLNGAQNELVVANLALIDRVLKGFRGGSRKHGREELESVAYIGLCEAAATFNAELGVPFAGFAWNRIKGAVMTFMEREDKYRDLVKQCLACGDEYAEMQTDQGEIDDTDADSKDRLRTAMSGMFASLAVGFFSSAGRHAGESAWVQSKAYRDALSTLTDVIASLPERDRRIVEMRYLEERGLEDVAKALSVSYISARRYHHAAMQRLGARLVARGVDGSSLAPG